MTRDRNMDTSTPRGTVANILLDDYINAYLIDCFIIIVFLLLFLIWVFKFIYKIPIQTQFFFNSIFSRCKCQKQGKTFIWIMLN